MSTKPSSSTDWQQVMSEGQQMKANPNTTFNHAAKHSWVDACDELGCQLVVLSQADLGNHVNFDLDEEAIRADERAKLAEKFSELEADYTVAWSQKWREFADVLSPPKPKTLEEVIEAVLPVAAYGRLTLTAVIDALREAFPELADNDTSS